MVPSSWPGIPPHKTHWTLFCSGYEIYLHWSSLLVRSSSSSNVFYLPSNSTSCCVQPCQAIAETIPKAASVSLKWYLKLDLKLMFFSVTKKTHLMERVMSERRRHLEQTCAAYRSGTRWEEVVHWIIFWPLVFVWELSCFDQTIFDVEQSVIPVFLTAISRLSKKEYNSAEPGLRQKVTHSSFLIDHTRRVMYCWNHKVSLDRKYWSQSSGRLPQVSGCGFSQRWVLGSSQRWDANSSKNFVPRSSEHFVPGLSWLMQITSNLLILETYCRWPTKILVLFTR